MENNGWAGVPGRDAVVAGGVFVNNGFVSDSTAGSPGRVVADFGALVKGAGYFQSTVVTRNDGRFQAGNSPGAASFGSFAFGPGGVTPARSAGGASSGRSATLPTVDRRPATSSGPRTRPTR